MGARRMGFEGEIYWGTAGTTAATQLLIARDIAYKFEPTEGDVSDRASIIEMTDVAMIKFTLEFEVNNDATNAFVAAMRTAAATGGAIAFRTKDRVTGYGVDGDFIIGDDESLALKDAQRLKISAKPTPKASRYPVFA